MALRKAASQTVRATAPVSARSNITAHQSGSFFNMNASESTKRNLLNQELGKIRAASASKPSYELDKQQKNIVHQLMLLDATTGKPFTSYAVNRSPGAASTSSGVLSASPQKTTAPSSALSSILGSSYASPASSYTSPDTASSRTDSSAPKAAPSTAFASQAKSAPAASAYIDPRQQYSDYLKQAKTPDLKEWQRMKSAGSSMTFSQYAHEKLNTKPKSYSQYTYEKSIGTPDYNRYEQLTGVDINALGAGGASERAAKQRQEEIQGRFTRNMDIEKTGKPGWLDATGHINGQARDGLGDMSFGPTIDEKTSSPFIRKKLHDVNEMLQAHTFGTVRNAGCESIAVYNTLHDLGKDVSLSQIIYDTERNNDMLWNGWFGTKTYKVDDILKMYGAESKPVLSKNIQSAADSGELNDGQIFLASIFNDVNALGQGFNGIHTFEIVYSPSAGNEKPWIVYNRGTEKEGMKYASLREALTYRDKTGAYITLHQIEG